MVGSDIVFSNVVKKKKGNQKKGGTKRTNNNLNPQLTFDNSDIVVAGTFTLFRQIFAHAPKNVQQFLFGQLVVTAVGTYKQCTGTFY